MKNVIRSILLAAIFAGIFVQISYGSQISELIERGLSTPITKTIRNLQPGISWDTANAHAWAIYQEAERTGISWKKIVAVAFQESSFKFFKGDKVCGLTPQGTAECIYRAYGPMHVYWEYWHESLDIDPHRLVSDWRYGYKIGVDILQRRMLQYKNEPCAVGTYNSTTEKYREQYCVRINKHLKRINNFLREQLNGLLP